MPAAEAAAAWQRARDAAGCPERVDAETVPVAAALGRVTAAPVWALRSSPDYDAAAMDGIAVRAADTVGASESTPLVLPAGAFEVVDTGDPMPAGRDAVVMREDVHHTGAVPSGAELRSAVAPWTHVRSIGEDIAATELLLPAGHRLRPFDLAAVVAAGVTEVVVRRAPRVAVVPTGDEIRPAGTPVGPGEIPDTNSLMLAGQARLLGAEVTVTAIVPDQPELITAAVRDAAATSDLVIVLAGSSAGRDDWTAQVVAEAGRAGRARGRGAPRAPGRARRRRRHPGARGARVPGVGRPDLRHLRGAAAGRARRCRAHPPAHHARPGWPASSPPPAAPTTGSGSGSAGSPASWSRPRCRAAPAS